MEHEDRGRVTLLLNSVRNGEKQGEAELFNLVYKQMRKLAQQQMSHERPGHTLQATALVHEAYLRIFGRGNVEWDSRSHFLAIASREFRRVLIEHARQAKAEKRGGGAPRISIDALAGEEPGHAPEADAIALHDLIDELQRMDPEAARVVELKFFGGMTDEESAEGSGMSVHTVRRHWTFARSWFLARLSAERKDL